MTEIDGLNAAYATSLLHDYLENPEAVPEEWRTLLAEQAASALAPPDGQPAPPAEAPPEPPPAPTPAPAAAEAPAPAATPELLAAVATAAGLIDAYRSHGHLAARLDPLGSEPIGDPELDASRLHALTPELARQIPLALLGLHVPAETLAEALPLLEETYCGTMAYEIEHISDHEERRWLRWAIESGQYRQPLAPEERRRLLERLSSVEAFEEYLRRAFLGQKQFSIEGLDVLVPMLDEAIELAARGGAHGVVVGMAHRGRLSVLAHTLGQPYEAILREFEGERAPDAVVGNPEGGTGDVKYHLGAEGTRETEAGTIVRHARLQPEPSRGREPRRRGLDARDADRPLGSPPARPVRRAADPHPRRRVLRRAGRRRRDVQLRGLCPATRPAARCT